MIVQNPKSRRYGEKEVTLEENTGLVCRVFDFAAGRYDLMNERMSDSAHRLGKTTGLSV
jgi:ubiquinone/menaquinone biosynthesis C-methylase UbiE